MKNRFLILLLALLFVGVAYLFYIQFNCRIKIGFVKSSELVYGYRGMTEAHSLQESKTNELKSNLDTLQADFQKAINQYNKEYASLSEKERSEKENLLSIQEQNLKLYSQNIQNTIKQNDVNLTQGILNQINTYVEEYAKKKGYTIIFGTTTSGNILYGEPAIDVTDDVLKGLNENYRQLPDSLGK